MSSSALLPFHVFQLGLSTFAIIFLHPYPLPSISPSPHPSLRLPLQQAQQLIEQHLAILDTEDWGSGLLCAGVWPDGFPSVLFSTEDSCFSTVLRDGQVLMFCLNTLSLQGKR